MRVFVFAGDARQFHSWCHENNVNPYKHDVKYVFDASRTLRGIDLAEQIIIFYGTWYNNRQYTWECDQYLERFGIEMGVDHNADKLADFVRNL